MGTLDRIRDAANVVRQIFWLIIEHKKWWLLPIFFVFSALLFFVALLGGSSVLPAIYALF